MNPKLFNKVFIGVIFFLVLFYSFFLGVDVTNGDTKEAIVDGVLLGFWLFALVFFIAMNRTSDKLDRELEESRTKLDGAMDDLLGHLKEETERKKRVHDAMHEALEVIGADRPPKPSEYKKVQDKFHELSGHYLRLTAVKGDKRPSAEVSDEPFETKPARKKAPVKKPVAKKTVTTKKGK